MRITQVELTNIKSYRQAVIPLQEGATAIRGRNGAGKSTLVEAIGYALFDALPYKQAQFVREGERTGSVTVTFISALDDREYQVVRRCGTSADWYVYDPGLGARLAEQKADMLAFLRQHLRIEGEVELSALFNDAIGVPQGSLTADFLDTAAQRKKKFDTLLQVEGYRKAAERLNDTRAYLVDQTHAQQRAIDALERETGQLADWRAERAAATRRASELTATLAQAEQESAQVETARETLRHQELELRRLEAAAQLAEATREAAERQCAVAAQRVAEAQTAVRVCQETQRDHDAYQRSDRRAEELRQRLAARNDAVAARAEVSQRLESARSDLKHAREQLAEAEQAARRAIALGDHVRQQGELERRHADAQREVERLREVQRQRGRADDELRAAEKELQEHKRALAALDGLAEVASHVAARRAQLEQLQAAAQGRAEREKRLAAVRLEVENARKTYATASAREAKAQESVRKISEQRAIAEQTPALEADYTAVEAEVHALEARIGQHRLSRTQSGQGQCPILGEPCLNIQRRGENNLGAYFDRLISADEVRVRPALERRRALLAQVEHARKVSQFYVRLPEYEDMVTQQRELRAQAEQTLARLATERDELEQAQASAPDDAVLRAARAHFLASDDADRKRSALPALQAVHASAQARLDTLRQQLAELDQQAAALAASEQAALQIAEALKQLGDPRSEQLAFEQLAIRQPEHLARVAETHADAARLEGELARCEEAIRPFASLDADLAVVEAERTRARDGYARYLQHQHLAASLGELETLTARLRQESAVAIATQSAAMAAAHAASQRFDQDELKRVSERADALRGLRATATETLRHTQAERERLEGEIGRAERLLHTLEAAREELHTLEELGQMLSQFRETIREAGPGILRAVLRKISGEANQIFGDIMGDRSAHLAWEDDYEIKLRRDGRERSFAQLSGGEQMSAALAVRLALLRSLSHLDVAFFDEPTQNMDGERRGNLAEQIRRVRGFDQLLVISHDDTFEQGLDNIVHLEKRNGETVLAEDELAVLA